MNEMEMLGGFDSTQIAPSTGGGGSLPISGPEGHLVVIVSHEARQNNDASSGSHMAVELRIVAGPHENVTGYHRLNLGHTKNPDTVRIAKQELSSICHCVGHLGPLPGGIADLYNRPFRAVVVAQKGKEAVEKGWTEIDKFLDQNGNKPGATVSATPGVAAPAPAPAPAAATPAPAPQPAPAPAPGAGGFPVDTGVAPVAAPAAPVAAAPAPAPAAQPAPAAAPAPAPAPAPAAAPQPAPVAGQPQWRQPGT